MHGMKKSHIPPVLAALLASLVVLLAGCASTIPVAECKDVDWLQVGDKDGSRGIPAKPPTAHVQACAESGVKLDASAYQQGWMEGIAKFCNPDNGWREGTIGNTNKANACKGQPGEAAYSSYFLRGKELYDLNEVRRKNSTEIRRVTQLENQSRNPTERRTLREQIRVLEQEQSRLRKQLAQKQTLAP